MTQGSYTSSGPRPQLWVWVDYSLHLQNVVNDAFKDYAQPLHRRAHLSTAIEQVTNGLIDCNVFPTYGDLWRMQNAKDKARLFAEYGDKPRCLAAIQQYMDAILAVIDRTPEGIAA